MGGLVGLVDGCLLSGLVGDWVDWWMDGWSLSGLVGDWVD